MKLLATLLTLSAISFSACDKPAAALPTNKAPSPIVPLASTAYGHFRVTILRDRHIDRATTQPGPIETVKTYPREIFQQAEFYVPAGAESRTIAALPDGRIMILEFRDLQLTPAAASAIQWGFDANFQIGSDSGHQRDWPMGTRTDPSQQFNVGQDFERPLGSFAERRGSFDMTLSPKISITYLGLIRSEDLMSAQRTERNIPSPIANPLAEMRSDIEKLSN